MYVLLGPKSDGIGEAIYVGEDYPVKPRLESHYKEKDFWNRAVFFVAVEGKLNKAHVQYLEYKLLELARNAKILPLENGNKPIAPSLSEQDRAYAEVFLDHMPENR